MLSQQEPIIILGPGAVSYVSCRLFSGETALVGPRPGRQSRKGSD